MDIADLIHLPETPGATAEACPWLQYPSPQQLYDPSRIQTKGQPKNNRTVGTSSHALATIGKGVEYLPKTDSKIHRPSTRSGKLLHDLQSTGVRKKPFSCSKCPAAFYQKGNLKKHVKARHERIRNFECDKCPATFSFRDGLVRHRTTHDPARPHKCETCGASFKQLAHKTKHVRFVHEKLRPAKCFCGISFRENYDLRLHLKSIHNMEP